jgi:hypothetical protein
MTNNQKETIVFTDMIPREEIPDCCITCYFSTTEEHYCFCDNEEVENMTVAVFSKCNKFHRNEYYNIRHEQ